MNYESIQAVSTRCASCFFRPQICKHIDVYLQRSAEICVFQRGKSVASILLPCAEHLTWGAPTSTSERPTHSFRRRSNARKEEVCCEEGAGEAAGCEESRSPQRWCKEG